MPLQRRIFPILLDVRQQRAVFDLGFEDPVLSRKIFIAQEQLFGRPSP
jgi:hypothetical protein